MLVADNKNKPFDNRQRCKHHEKREPARHQTIPKNKVSRFPLTSCPRMDLTVHELEDNKRKN